MQGKEGVMIAAPRWPVSRKYRCRNIGIAACFFSPPGRRWPEGSDEGATLPYLTTLAPLIPLPRPSPRRGEEARRTRSLHMQPPGSYEAAVYEAGLVS